MTSKSKKWYAHPLVKLVGFGGLLFLLNIVTDAGINKHQTDTLKADVEKVETQADKNTEKIAKANTKIAVIETQMTNMNTKLDNIQDRMTEDNALKTELLQALNNLNKDST